MKIPRKILTLLTIGKRLCELLLTPNLSGEIRNWPRFLADFIFPIPGRYTLILRSLGRITLRGQTIDKFPVSEVIVRDDYQLRTLTTTPPKIIIDIGASIGEFCIYAAIIYPHSTIYAYEPDPNAFAILKYNVSDNTLEKRVFIFSQAVAGSKSRARLYMSQTSGHASLITHTPLSRLVSTIRLEDIFSKHKIRCCDLLKMDIEGAEYALLYSVPRRIYKKIRRIHLECHNFGDIKFTSQALTKFLEERGFSVEKRSAYDRNLCMLYARNQHLC